MFMALTVIICDLFDYFCIQQTDWGNCSERDCPDGFVVLSTVCLLPEWSPTWVQISGLVRQCVAGMLMYKQSQLFPRQTREFDAVLYNLRPFLAFGNGGTIDDGLLLKFYGLHCASGDRILVWGRQHG